MEIGPTDRKRAQRFLISLTDQMMISIDRRLA